MDISSLNNIVYGPKYYSLNFKEDLKVNLLAILAPYDVGRHIHVHVYTMYIHVGTGRGGGGLNVPHGFFF